MEITRFKDKGHKNKTVARHKESKPVRDRRRQKTNIEEVLQQKDTN